MGLNRKSRKFVCAPGRHGGPAAVGPYVHVLVLLVPSFILSVAHLMPATTTQWLPSVHLATCSLIQLESFILAIAAELARKVTKLMSPK